MTPSSMISNHMAFFVTQPQKTPRPIAKMNKHQKPAVLFIQPATRKMRQKRPKEQKPAITATSQGKKRLPNIPKIGPKMTKRDPRTYLQVTMKVLIGVRSRAGQPA